MKDERQWVWEKTDQHFEFNLDVQLIAPRVRATSGRFAGCYAEVLVGECGAGRFHWWAQVTLVVDAVAVSLCLLTGQGRFQWWDGRGSDYEWVTARDAETVLMALGFDQVAQEKGGVL